MGCFSFVLLEVPRNNITIATLNTSVAPAFSYDIRQICRTTGNKMYPS